MTDTRHFESQQSARAMGIKSEKEKVQSLVAETVTLLCKNGLSFKAEFSIEALVGITLDNEQEFFFTIKENVKTSIPIRDEVVSESAGHPEDPANVVLKHEPENDSSNSHFQAKEVKCEEKCTDTVKDTADLAETDTVNLTKKGRKRPISQVYSSASSAKQRHTEPMLGPTTDFDHLDHDVVLIKDEPEDSDQAYDEPTQCSTRNSGSGFSVSLAADYATKEEVDFANSCITSVTPVAASDVPIGDIDLGAVSGHALMGVCQKAQQVCMPVDLCRI